MPVADGEPLVGWVNDFLDGGGFRRRARDGAVWQDGTLRADCERSSEFGALAEWPHDAPGPGCECGIEVRMEPSIPRRCADPTPVIGLVEAWGRTIVESGFVRAEHARLLGVAPSPLQPSGDTWRVRDEASSAGAPFCASIRDLATLAGGRGALLARLIASVPADQPVVLPVDPSRPPAMFRFGFGPRRGQVLPTALSQRLLRRATFGRIGAVGEIRAVDDDRAVATFAWRSASADGAAWCRRAGGALAIVLLAVLLPGTASAEPTRLTVAASGDLLIHAPLYARARRLGGGRRYEFRPFLRYVRPWIEGADVALCHVETPMTSAPPAGYPRFNTPPALAGAIAATGWDACSTASNHSLDRGIAGIAGTRRALARARVKFTGSFLTAGQRSATTFLEVKGVRIAFLSYTEMTNGIPLPRPWSVNLARAARILADARLARRRGADVVIVNVHWGQEFRSAPSPFQLGLARRLAASPDITAIVGQHVHVVQPIRFLGETPVVFGEGNLLSNQSSACCPAGAQDGLVAFLDLVVPDSDRARVERVRYLPTWVGRGDYAVLPVGDAVTRGLAPRSSLLASYRRTIAAAGRSKRIMPVPAALP